MLLILLFLALGYAPSAQSALQRGLFALRDGNLIDARQDFESVLKQEPQNAFAWVSLAETCRRLGDNASSLTAAQKAETYGEKLSAVDHALASFYAKTGDFARAAPLEEKYAATRPMDTEAMLRAAGLYEQAHDIKNADRLLKPLAEKHADDPIVSFAYAQVLLSKLDFSGADQVIAPALAAHPDDAQLVVTQGVIRYGERKFADAITEFLRVIEIDRTIPQPYLFLGKMLEHAGDRLPLIASTLEARAKESPDDPMLNLEAAKARLATNNKDADAERLLRHSLELDNKQWEGHYELGVLLENKHQFKEAADELNKSVEADPKQAMPHYHLARVYDRLGQPELAQEQRKLHEQLSDIPK